MSLFHRQLSLLLLVAALILGSGCRRKADSGNDLETELDEVILQTDWFPQPEHGGFYQALARGFYEEAGLSVTILPGGPNAMSTQKVLKGRAHFAMNRADTIYSLCRRDVPVTMVMATLQHDPQALLLHSSNPLSHFEELDGRQVMAIPGLAWIRWLESRYGIELDIIPHDFGIERFLNDPEFIQQCLLTNEPFYVRQAGLEAKVLPLRESGFDPYHGIYCLRSLIEGNPDLVERFVRASLRGWRDFILNDPAPALALIAGQNPKMNEAFMAFSYGAMRDGRLVTGDDPEGGLVGELDPARMETLAREIEDLGMLENASSPAGKWYTTQFLPKPGGVPVNELP
ncbi:MAG: ABC transporter substrate-binding protein [Puniceicoccaceae bacterium]